MRALDLGGTSIEMVVRRLTLLRSTSPTVANSSDDPNIEDLLPVLQALRLNAAVTDEELTRFNRSRQEKNLPPVSVDRQ